LKHMSHFKHAVGNKGHAMTACNLTVCVLLHITCLFS